MTTKCAVIGCNNIAVQEWGGRPHCEDCLPAVMKNRIKFPDNDFGASSYVPTSEQEDLEKFKGVIDQMENQKFWNSL